MNILNKLIALALLLLLGAGCASHSSQGPQPYEKPAAATASSKNVDPTFSSRDVELAELARQNALLRRQIAQGNAPVQQVVVIPHRNPRDTNGILSYQESAQDYDRKVRDDVYRRDPQPPAEELCEGFASDNTSYRHDGHQQAERVVDQAARIEQRKHRDSAEGTLLVGLGAMFGKTILKKVDDHVTTETMQHSGNRSRNCRYREQRGGPHDPRNNEWIRSIRIGR